MTNDDNSFPVSGSARVGVPVCAASDSRELGAVQTRRKSRVSRLRAAFLCLALSAGATACAEIPTQELSQYRLAFAEVQDASEEVLVDFAEAIKNAEVRATPEPTERAAPLFSTQLESLGAKQPETVEVRRLALRTIDKFNNTLVTLAEGQSVAAVQGAAGGFVEAAGNFAVAAAGTAVPGLSAIAGLVQTLAGEFEKARLREEFETAVRDGAPIIDKMLLALIDERGDHLTLRASEANLRNVEIVDAVTEGARSLRDLVAGHGAPAGDDPLPALQDRLDAALRPVAPALTFSLPLTLRYAPSGPPFGADQSAIAGQVVAELEQQSRNFQANAAQYESLRSALNNYGVMLEKTRVALRGLVDALDRPPKFEEAAEDLFQIAFSLKRDIEAFRAARKADQ